MQIKSIKTDIVCDMPGCRNLAKYYIAKSTAENFGFNLCEDCLSRATALYLKTKNKGGAVVGK